MKVPYRALSCALLAGASLTAVASEPFTGNAEWGTQTTQGLWSGVGVSLYSPLEPVWRGWAFDLGVQVDSTGYFDGLGFAATMVLDPYVDLTVTHWTYEFFREDGSMYVTSDAEQGPLAYTTRDDGRYEIALPAPGSSWGETYLYGPWGEQVRWTLTDIVIQDNAFFEVSLSSDYNGVASFQSPRVLVVDPPFPVSAVPEPSSLALVLSSVGCVGLVAWRRRRDDA